MRQRFSAPSPSAFCFAFVVMLFASQSHAEDRIWVSASLNGKSIKLAFDTGASDLVLFRPAAVKLGVKITEPPANARISQGAVRTAVTEPLQLLLGGRTFTQPWRVVDLPPGPLPDCDGLIGWGPLRNNVIGIDGRNGHVTVGADVPREEAGWIKLPVRDQEGLLKLEYSNASGPHVLLIDTGRSDGVCLNPARWDEWVAAHPSQKSTILAYVTVFGTKISPVYWADELTLGPITLHGVPVMRANSQETSMQDLEAVLGMYALRRLELVVDGKERCAFVRPLAQPAPAFQHNRLGAVFVPKDAQSETLVAHVAAGSPAERAGIRDGDALQAIDNLDVTKWRTDPTVLPLSRFWEMPPGTHLTLTIRRVDSNQRIEVVLADILSPTTHEAN